MKKLIIASALLLLGGTLTYGQSLTPQGVLQKKKKKRISSTTISYPLQCQALTKKGTQCKRNARSGGYCWQHGG